MRIQLPVLSVALVIILGVTFVGKADTLTDTTQPTIDTVRNTPQNYVVTIGRIHIDNQQLDDTLLVMLKTGGQSLGGFDFKIGIDNPLVDIVEIIPGEIYDSCRWEYFNARQMNTADKENYPPILWQVVALAELIPDSVRPVCYGLDQEASLLKIVISNEHVFDVPDTVVPIFFFWEDCGDNTISGAKGNILLMSKQVFDYYGAVPAQAKAVFPTRTGAPLQCIKPGSLNKPSRQIEFHDGGVEFKLDIGIDSTVQKQ